MWKYTAAQPASTTMQVAMLGLAIISCTCTCISAALLHPEWLDCSWLTALRKRHRKSCHRFDEDDDSDLDVDVPDKYLDPITHEIIEDPVVLCATGQVYEYSSLKSWFLHGGLVCPKTNQEVHDVQIIRLPWFRAEVEDWLAKHGKQATPMANSIAALAELNAQLAEHVRLVRSGAEDQRHQALAQLVRGLRLCGKQAWSTRNDTPAARTQQQEFRTGIVDDMTWLMRYGDVYSQGVAASICACCDQAEELHWLALTGVVPLTALLLSTGSYGQEWALLTLYSICLACKESHPLMWRAGTCQALLSLISKPAAVVNFHRDRAAVVLAHLASQEVPKRWIRKHGVQALVAMMHTSQDRWEKRDAAFCLLALSLPHETLAEHGLSLRQLQDLRWCSQRWLDKQVDNPQEGLTRQEVRARRTYERQMARYRAQRAQQRLEQQAAAAAAAGQAGADGEEEGGGPEAAAEGDEEWDGEEDGAGEGSEEDEEDREDEEGAGDGAADVDWGSDEAEDDWEEQHEEGEQGEEDDGPPGLEDAAQDAQQEDGEDDGSSIEGDGPDLATDHLDSDDDSEAGHAAAEGSNHSSTAAAAGAAGSAGSSLAAAAGSSGSSTAAGSGSSGSSTAAGAGASGGSTAAAGAVAATSSTAAGAAHSKSDASSSNSSSPGSESIQVYRYTQRSSAGAVSSSGASAREGVAGQAGSSTSSSSSTGGDPQVPQQQQQQQHSTEVPPQEDDAVQAASNCLNMPSEPQQQQQRAGSLPGPDAADSELLDQAWPVSSLVKQLQLLNMHQQQEPEQHQQQLNHQQQQA